MKVRALLLPVFLFAVSVACGQKTYSVTFGELELKMAAAPRPILIKIYTDWCSVCKIQDKQLEKDVALQNVLKNDYYFLELNAESRETITFNNKTFHFIPNGIKNGLHLLASTLSKANSYPSWVLLSAEYEIIAVQPGFIDVKTLKIMLTK